MRVKRWLALALLCLWPLGMALAEEIDITGTWSGSIRGAGMTVSMSITFDSEGGFQASAAGRSVSGSYEIEDQLVTLSAAGTSMQLAYESDGLTESMAGSATYAGITGTVALAREASVGDTEPVEAEPTVTPEPTPEPTPRPEAIAVYGAWSAYQNGVRYSARVYPGGYLLWTEERAELSLADQIKALNKAASGDPNDGVWDVTDSDAGADFTPVRFGCAMRRETGLLALTPLSMGEAPAHWSDCWDAARGAYLLPCAVSSKSLVVEALALTFDGDLPELADDAAFAEVFAGD